ncbi:MAG: DUF3006 domain-containing protein [Deltaproteobacteria bacterium]|nr:DUF3006 domain-containing protein [Deltaproteobacteria bacterium]
MTADYVAKMLRATVDSVEDGKVVLDCDGELIRLPASLLPAPPHEGDHFILTITADPAEKGTMQQRIMDRLAALSAASEAPPPAAPTPPKEPDPVP